MSAMPPPPPTSVTNNAKSTPESSSKDRCSVSRGPPGKAHCFANALAPPTWLLACSRAITCIMYESDTVINFCTADLTCCRCSVVQLSHRADSKVADATRKLLIACASFPPPWPSMGAHKVMASDCMSTSRSAPCIIPTAIVSCFSKMRARMVSSCFLGAPSIDPNEPPRNGNNGAIIANTLSMNSSNATMRPRVASLSCSVHCEPSQDQEIASMRSSIASAYLPKCDEI
mmetsp:Transcript_3680/g.9399  ORF Transcript_3680/g.9399 Transcript_3680/m.9399 type:complete len:230 (+) Transcript_3680:1385-2074(+)